MKLSEAIIKGCEGTYQVGDVFTDGQGGYCVIGAAKLAAGIPDDEMRLTHLSYLFPVATGETTHPVNGDLCHVVRACISLNDTYKWPRLSIAEWLANVVEPEFEK